MVSYGTNESICRLVETYSDMLLRLASSRLPNVMDAEDAVQEVFLSLVRRGATFENEDHERAWLVRATLHRAADIRRRKRNAEIPLDEAPEIGVSDETGPELLDAVRALPEKYAAVIFLFYYEDCSLRECARLLGVSERAAGTRLHRARQLLKEALKEDFQ